MKQYRHRSFHVILGTVLLSLLLAACGNSGNSAVTGNNTQPAGKGCTNVAILLPETATSERWDNKDKPLLIQKIKAALPAGSPDPQYYNAENDAAKQQNQADTALTKGACIMVVAAKDGDAAAAIVAKAKAKNVPVIAYDRLIQSKDLTAYVSFDNTKVGELQGQYILDHYKDFTTASTINLAMINGSQTDNNAILFRQGALNKLQPKFDDKTFTKVYDQYTPDWDNDTARTEMDAVLTAQQNNLQIAYVANDGMANSVIASLKAKKLNGKVLVTGQDASVAGLQNILLGDQAMTVYKAITQEAQGTADVVKALYDGTNIKTVATDSIQTKDGATIPSIFKTPVAIDKSNVNLVIQDNYVTVDQVCQGLPKGLTTLCP
jgi:D-xylose transport system substrate-binding protein